MLGRLFGPKRPRPDAALRRLLILKHSTAHLMTTPPLPAMMILKARWSSEEWDKFLATMQARSRATEQALRDHGLWRLMTDKERTFIASPFLEIIEQQRMDTSWLMEGAVCLLWALGYLESLPAYDAQTPPELLKLAPSGEAGALAKAASLRPDGEIDKARDVAELWHWRSRTRGLQEKGGYKSRLPPGMTFESIIAKTAQLAAADGDIPQAIGDDFPAFGKPYREATAEEFATLTSIAMERHRAFNWLCGMAPGHRWDKTPTDT